MDSALSVRLEKARLSLRAGLLAKQETNGAWRGELSASAIAVSAAVTALDLADPDRYVREVERGLRWLANTARPDGWGDSPESPANLTATLMTYAALTRRKSPITKAAVHRAEKALSTHFKSLDPATIREGVLRTYGKDLTFSAPILTLCAATGLLGESPWEKVPQLPFEWAALPQNLLRFLRFPVVSYAIPALIAVGLVRHCRAPEQHFGLTAIRDKLIPRLLKKLASLQPESGGFLEAIPLTAFVTICLIEAGYRDHDVTQKAISFLVGSVREDGSWSIDSDLSIWVTSLSVRALRGDFPKTQKTKNFLFECQQKTPHPYIQTSPGGWGWTPRSGSVPDADDTPAALIALHTLNPHFSPEIEAGIRWIFSLQNSNGGVPTFCKGWGLLPFDRSCPDLTAHAFRAFTLWEPLLPEKLRSKCRNSRNRMLRWLQSNQHANGSWLPLWFGDQEAEEGHNPVYGTAVVLEHLWQIPETQPLKGTAICYLLSAQNPDGGWGGAANAPSKLTLTAKAVAALSGYSEAETAVERGLSFLLDAIENEPLPREPIGLYFAKLWYSEALYAPVFILNALETIREKRCDDHP